MTFWFHCCRRKPDFTQRVVSSDSDSDDLVPNAFVNRPSTSRTPIDKPKTEKPRISLSPGKKTYSRPQGELPSSSPGLGHKRSIQALTGLKDGFVFRLEEAEKKRLESDARRSLSDQEMLSKCNGRTSDDSMDEGIPEGESTYLKKIFDLPLSPVKHRKIPVSSISSKHICQTLTKCGRNHL